MSQTLTFPRWVVSGSGWQTSHSATALVSVNRAYGSDVAVVSITWEYTSIGGDTAKATGHVTINGTSYTETIVGQGTHYAGAKYTKTQSFEVSVGASSGTLSGSCYISIDDASATSGKNSSTQSFSQTYQSKGASTIDTPIFTAGVEGVFKVTKNSPSFTHRLWYRLNSSDSWHTIDGSAQKTETSVKWTPPLSLCNNWTTSTNGTVQILIRTYQDGTQISTDSSTTYTVTVRVPSDVVPTISGVAWSDSQTKFSVYTRTLSQLTATITASSLYGATISSYSLNIDGATYTGTNKAVSMDRPLGTSGSVKAVITVVDSRGRSAKLTNDLTVYDLYTPYLAIDVSVENKDIVIAYTWDVAPVNNLNTRTLTFVLKRLSDSTSTSYPVALSSYSGSAVFRLTTSDADYETYSVTATLTDKITSTVLNSSTGQICISRLAGGKGVAFFKEAEREGVDINGDLFIKNHSSAVGSTVNVNSDTSVALAANAQVILGHVDLGEGVWVVQANTTISSVSSGTNRVWATLTTNSGTSWNASDEYGYQSQTVTSGKDCGFNITRVVTLTSDNTLYLRVKSDSYARNATKTYINAVRIV